MTEPDTEQETQKRARDARLFRWVLALAAVVIVFMVGVAIQSGSFSHQASTTTATEEDDDVVPPDTGPFAAVGTVTLTDPDGVGILTDAVTPGQDCLGIGGYSDISTGAQVVVTDAAGKTIAVGTLGQGSTDNTPSKTSFGSTTYKRCVIPFTVAGIPTGEDFYGVQVGHRGAIQQTEAQLRDTSTLAFTLG